MTAKSPKKPKSKIKLVCFDFDNTLVDFHPHRGGWDVFHAHCGTKKTDDKNAELFKKGLLSYKDWTFISSMVLANKKPHKDHLKKTVLKAKRMKNALKTLKALKKKGFKLALVSGGIDFVSDAFFPRKLFDHFVIERALFSKDGILEGIFPECLELKLAHIKRIAKEEGISLKEIAFVGDGGNDIEAIEAVGLGIAFNSKNEKLKAAADVVIEEKDLSKILEHL